MYTKRHSAIGHGKETKAGDNSRKDQPTYLLAVEGQITSILGLSLGFGSMLSQEKRTAIDTP